MSAADLALSRLATTAGIAGLAIGALGGAAFAAGVASGVIGAPPAPDRFSGNSVKFPEELDQNDHWIEFTAKQTKGLIDSVGGINVGSTTLGGTMRLPMPSNLSTDYNPQYSTPDLGPAAGMALKPSDQAIYNNNTMGNQALIGQNLQGLINAVAGGAAGALVGAATGLGDKLGGAVGGEGVSGALLKVGAGVAVNPHKIVLFTGVNFRDHTFSWKLSPKTRRDSDTIRQIINMFTYYAHPEYVAGGLFLKYPEFFTIKFHHPEYLFTLQPSVLTDIRVNYHGQGYPAYIRDANGFGTPAPAEVDLSLTFKETEIVTKQSLNPSIDITNNTPRQRPPSPAAPLYTDSNGPIVIGPNGTPLYGP